MGKKYIVLLFSFLFATNAYATVLLKHNMADPGAFVTGGTLYFAGTSDHTEKIEIYAVPTSDVIYYVNLSNTYPLNQYSLEPVVPSYIYDPRQVVINMYGSHHKYCNVTAPDFAYLLNGTIKLTFTAVFKANTDESCNIVESQYGPAILQAEVNLNTGVGAPLWITYNTVWDRTHQRYETVSGTQALPGSSNFNHDNIRIDSSIFADTSTGKEWFSYVWFTGQGNAISTVQTAGANLFLFDNTFPNFIYDEGIREAPEIFKRNGWYYFVYSENWFNSKYQAYYKKATSVENLTDSSSTTCRLTFNSWETRPNNTSSGYNAGKGSVVQIGSDYYLIYHIGHGNPLIRDTYIDKLRFDAYGNIYQIPIPAFI
ncbi:MAG: hypothetical protein EPN88_09855, partial [Bacteroidetes bacterium]